MGKKNKIINIIVFHYLKMKKTGSLIGQLKKYNEK